MQSYNNSAKVSVMDQPATVPLPARSKLSWKWAPVVGLALAICPGVVAAVLINVSGATLIDGLFGIYRNTPLQSFIVNAGILITLAGPLLSLVFSIVFMATRKDLRPIRRALPLIVFITVPAAIVAIVLLLSELGIIFG